MTRKTTTSMTIDCDADLARALVEDIKRETGTVPVFTRGQVYCYDPRRGVWAIVSSDELRLRFQSYHRKAKTSQRYRPTLLVSNAIQESALRVFQTLTFSPDFFDTAPLGVAFSNGFLCVTPSGMTFLDDSHEHRCDLGYDFSYPGQASEPKQFSALLGSLFENDPDSDAKIQAIREYIGLCLLGVATRLQTVLLFFGPAGNNGKSLLISAIEMLFPARHRRSLNPKDWGHEYYKAQLAGPRINLVSELKEEEMPDPATFKAVISGDIVTGRHPTERPFDFKPIAGHILACNRLPNSADTSGGFFRRFVIITFNKIFDRSQTEQSLLLPLQQELAQIVAWSLAATPQALSRNLIVPPDSHNVIMDQWRATSDQAHAFVAACTNKGGTVNCATAYTVFQEYCQKVRCRCLTFPEFTQRLGLLGYSSKRGDTGFVYPFVLLPMKQWRLK